MVGSTSIPRGHASENIPGRPIFFMISLKIAVCVKQEGAMSYTIGFVTENRQQILAAKTSTANEALAFVESLQKGLEEIKFIQSPHEGEFGIEMLRILAREEADEMPKRSA